MFVEQPPAIPGLLIIKLKSKVKDTLLSNWVLVLKKVKVTKSYGLVTSSSCKRLWPLAEVFVVLSQCVQFWYSLTNGERMT